MRAKLAWGETAARRPDPPGDVAADRAQPGPVAARGAAGTAPRCTADAAGPQEWDGFRRAVCRDRRAVVKRAPPSWRRWAGGPWRMAMAAAVAAAVMGGALGGSGSGWTAGTVGVARAEPMRWPAQASPQQRRQPAPERDDGGRSAPRPGAEEARRAELDRLFAALRDAPDEAAAALVEARIHAVWLRGASPSVQLLMQRGLRSMEARAPEEALEDFDAAITLAPDFAEAWHRRAQAYAAAGDIAAAMRDLQETLRLEPRHFGALVTLSAIQEEAGDLIGALRSFQAALEIHPKLRGAEMRLRDLRRRALGEET